MPIHAMRNAFTFLHEGDGTTVHFPAGTGLSEEHVQAVAGRLCELVADRAHTPLTLDLSEVVTVSSGALGKLLGLNRAVGAAGGRLILADPTSVVRRVFRVTRLDTVLTIHTGSAAGAI